MSNGMINADIMPEYTSVTKIGAEWVCTYPIESSSPEDNYVFRADTPERALSLAVAHFESGLYVIGKVQEKRMSAHPKRRKPYER